MSHPGNCFPFYDKNYSNIIVEGPVDEYFITRITDKVKVKNIEDWNKTENLFKGKKLFVNNKLQVLSVLRNFLSDSKSNVYGMIDRDFDENYDGYCDIFDKLFITDTHDVETLLLKTSKDLLFNVGDSKIISENDIHRSYYLAYQIGIIKKALFLLNKNSDDSTRKINFDDVYINVIKNYEDICENDSICLDKLLDYINVDSIIRSFETIKKFYNLMPYYRFNLSLDDFRSKVLFVDDNDFWNLTNGHDILNLLIFFNDQIKKCLESKYPHYKYTRFEHALVYEYKILNFKKSDMFKKMSNIQRFLKVQLLA